MADRGHWPVRVFRLGEEPSEDLSSTTSPEERLAMVWTLTLEAWSLSGRDYAEYARAQTPAGLNEDFRGDNADRVWAALQIGLPPRRIDILTSVSGVGFEAAWPDLEALGEPLD